MHLTREEQETNINFDASSPTASIFSCHPATIRKLEKLTTTFPDVYKRVKIDKWGGYHYEMPTRLIRFGKPASEAKKEAGRRNAAKGSFLTSNSREKNSSDCSDV